MRNCVKIFSVAAIARVQWIFPSISIDLDLKSSNCIQLGAMKLRDEDETCLIAGSLFTAHSAEATKNYAIRGRLLVADRLK